MKNFLLKNKLLTVILIAYLMLVAGLVLFLRNPSDGVIKYLFSRTISQEQSRNPFATDGLYVVTTGTGAPMPDIKRTGPQTIVVAGDQVLVFDSGPGSTLKLERSPVDVADVDALFITHFHSDHIGGMGELFLKRWASASPGRPLPVYGPTGINEVVNGFETAYNYDKGFRIAHHGEEIMPPSGFGGEAKPFDLGIDLMSSRSIYNEGNVEVIAFNVAHAPVFPAVGYRITYKDRSVVITGDTKYSESLIHHSRDADLLISEALNMKFATMMAEAGKNTDTNMSQIAIDIQDYHISPEEAAYVADAAGVRQLLITHIIPPVPVKLLERPFLKEARQNFRGDIYMANDGTMLTLPARSDEISIQELLK